MQNENRQEEGNKEQKLTFTSDGAGLSCATRTLREWLTPLIEYINNYKIDVVFLIKLKITQALRINDLENDRYYPLFYKKEIKTNKTRRRGIVWDDETEVIIPNFIYFLICYDVFKKPIQNYILKLLNFTIPDLTGLEVSKYLKKYVYRVNDIYYGPQVAMTVYNNFMRNFYNH